MAKITNDQVLAVQALLASGVSTRKVAHQVGISRETVRHIQIGRRGLRPVAPADAWQGLGRFAQCRRWIMLPCLWCAVQELAGQTVRLPFEARLQLELAADELLRYRQIVHWRQASGRREQPLADEFMARRRAALAPVTFSAVTFLQGPAR